MNCGNDAAVCVQIRLGKIQNRIITVYLQKFF